MGLLVGAYFLMEHLGSGYQGEQLVTAPTQDTQADQEDTATDPVPDFTVYDAQGNPVKLSDMRGKPVVINLWASWCSPCKNEMPGFQNLAQKYDGEVVFMMVNVTGIDTMEDAQAFIQSQGYTFPVYYDKDNSAATNYYSGSVPMTYFINSDGEYVTHAVGAIDESLLEKGIGMIKN